MHLDAKENKWQSADGRTGPIGPVNISAAHAQKAARSGAPKLLANEIEKILVEREQARARRDYKTADVLRDQLEKHGVYLDSKEKKWHSADGRSGAIIVSSLSDEEIGKILANRQAARLRHDYKAADRLRDQLNEQAPASPTPWQPLGNPRFFSHGPSASGIRADTHHRLHTWQGLEGSLLCLFYRVYRSTTSVTDGNLRMGGRRETSTLSSSTRSASPERRSETTLRGRRRPPPRGWRASRR